MMGGGGGRKGEVGGGGGGGGGVLGHLRLMGGGGLAPGRRCLLNIPSVKKGPFRSIPSMVPACTDSTATHIRSRFPVTSSTTKSTSTQSPGRTLDCAASPVMSCVPEDRLFVPKAPPRIALFAFAVLPLYSVHSRALPEFDCAVRLRVLPRKS